MSMAYIRKAYGVPAKRGHWVEWLDPWLIRRVGKITGARDSRLLVRFLGDEQSRALNPKDRGLIYLKSASLSKAQKNRGEV